MNEISTSIVTFISGAAGAIGGVWFAQSFIGEGIKHFFAIAAHNRSEVGKADLEFREQQLTELYGPIYGYAKLNQQLYALWMAKKITEINTEVIALFRQQNERIIEILSTKMHLLEGEKIPAEFVQFMTSVTLWNIYTARHDQPWFPEEVARLPDAKYPKEFEDYIFTTTEQLKSTIDALRRKYRIT